MVPCGVIAAPKVLTYHEERLFPVLLLYSALVYVPQVTEELVESDMVNARNLAQLLWSLAKLGNPKASAGQLLSHPEEGLREIGPLRFGSRGAETVQAAKGLETPQRKVCVRVIVMCSACISSMLAQAR